MDSPTMGLGNVALSCGNTWDCAKKSHSSFIYFLDKIIMESLPGKRIVQSTFDDIVKENIEELELEPEEAVSDAIEQFKAQVREYIFVRKVWY